MNVFSRAAVLVLAVAGLAACATTMDDRSARVSPQPTIDADAVYMNRVEALARRRGIDVVWINPPSTDEKRLAGP